MRYALLTLLLAACGGGDDSFDYPLDGTLRLNHVQAKGTHNSFHVATTTFPPYGYSHVPLDDQLEHQGVRHFELDLYFYDQQAEAPYFEVQHLPFDAGTTCLRLAECLGRIAGWSRAHPAHQPIFIMFDLKDSFSPARANPLYDALEAAVLTAFPRERVLAPGRVQGDAPTLREAVMTHGWPTLGELRGHVFFALLAGGEEHEAYRGRTGKLFFFMSSPTDPDAAIVNIDTPDAATIGAALAQNLLVRTRADADNVEPLLGDRSRLERALASGAQLISTDYPAPVDGVPYSVDLPGGEPSRCSPVTAPAECSARAVEDPSFMK